MAAFLSAKMKRKDLEDVNDEFSEFSLSGPAKKIRRLDVELAPIMEEEEPAAPLVFEQQLPKEQVNTTAEQISIAEAWPALPLDKQKALVLYKPVNTSLLPTPISSGVSFKVNSDLIARFKNQALWQGNSNAVTVEEAHMEDDQPPTMSDEYLAVVPWVPSQVPATTQNMEGSGLRTRQPHQLMETEEEGASMEVEEEKEQAATGGIEIGGEDFQQWQQHWITPPSAPVMCSYPFL